MRPVGPAPTTITSAEHSRFSAGGICVMIARVHPAGVVAHHPSVRSTRGGVGRRELYANLSQQLVSLHLEAPESVAQSGGDQRSRGLDEVDAPDARPPRQW